MSNVGNGMVSASTRNLWWIGSLYATHSFTSCAYEVVWINLLASGLGQTLTAMTMVMAVFIAGLGLGAAALARLSRRHSLPLRWLFVGIQGVLGGFGLAFPWLLGWMDQVYIGLVSPIESLQHYSIRMIITTVLLLPQACLMGAVFPLLGTAAERLRPATQGRGAGMLYSLGLLWSGIGALVVPLWLVPALGYTGTSLFLAGLNGLGAVAGWPLIDRPAPRAALSMPSSVDGTARVTTSILVCSGVLGFCLFAVEGIGAQYMWLIVDATVYAEGLLFGTVLVGMAMGTAVYLGLRRVNVPAAGSIVGGGTLFALALLLWLLLAADIARIFDHMLHWTVTSWSTAFGFFVAHGVIVMAILGGPAVATGLAFPALCELAMRRHGTAAHALGTVTAWHYVGAMLGAICTVSVMVPLLGLTMSLAVLGSVLLLSVGIFFMGPDRHKVTVWVGSAATALVYLWLGGTQDVTFRAAAAGDGHAVRFHHEDGSGIVEVYEDRQTGYRTLRSSRLRQEGRDDPEAIRVQRVQGALPVLLHPAPRRLLVVGLGTGISLSANLRPEVERLTCVELSAGVIHAASWFEQANQQVLHHPKVTVVRQDGRNFVKLSRQRYDVIIQDLFFPYRAGVGNLYTWEHYRHVRSRLAKGGRVGQWIALNQVGLPELQSLVRTFTDVFPHTSLWLTGGYLLLYGGLEPLHLTWPTFQQRFDTVPPITPTTISDFLSMFVATGPAVHHWAAKAPRNTDDNALIEYRAPRTFATLNSTALAVSNLRSLLPLHGSVAALISEAPADVRQQLSSTSKAARLLWKGIVARDQGQLAQARDHYERAYDLNPSNYQVRRFLERDWAARGRQALLAGRLSSADALLRRALSLNPHNPDATFDRALVQSKHGNHAAAVTLLEQLVRQHAAFSQARFNLGVSLYHVGRYAEAAAQFKHLVAQEPHHTDAVFNLATSLAQAGEYQAAVHWYQRTLALAPGHQLARDNLRTLQTWRAAPHQP